MLSEGLNIQIFDIEGIEEKLGEKRFSRVLILSPPCRKTARPPFVTLELQGQ
jgi:hypothetical protein